MKAELKQQWKNVVAETLRADGLPGLREAFAMLRQAWDGVQRAETKKLAGQFTEGRKVKFAHNGCVQRGKVLWVNEKTVSVDVDGRRWRVPPRLLHVVDD